MVADRIDRRHAVYGLALIGLTILVHYAWAFVPEADQARVWNISGAIGRLALLGVVAVLGSSVLQLSFDRLSTRVLLYAWAWWVSEELLTIGCNVVLLYAPRFVPPGFSVCQSLLQIDFGRFGAVAAALLLLPTVRSYRCADTEGG